MMECKHSTIFSNPPRVLLIGLGPFAKRAYIPHLESLEAQGRARLMAVVDIESNEHALRTYQQAVLKNVELIFVPYFTSEIPESVKLTLTDLVTRLRISCVIISTEPLAHCAYGLWALDMGLNIVMDKPVTTRPSAVSSLEESYGIAKDFDKLLEHYSTLQNYQNTCFLINSHRRYHVGFHRTAEIVKQVEEKTGCPVTSINAIHCDGQWRLPSEIILQDYHTYNRGYGKVSHSGYHTIDSVYQLLKAGMGATKKPDMVEVISSFVQPRGFFFQLNEQDYQRLFGAKAYASAAKFSENELHEYTREFGEMDASVQLTFYHAGEAIALVHLDLQHNGFGRRTWLQPGQDLYKGNGRVRHEMYEIKSGPFQTIIVNSRQSSDRHDILKENHEELGGNGHFDIEIFQNCEMLGHQQPLQIIKLDDLIVPQPLRLPNSYSRSVKHAALDEMIEFVERKKGRDDLKSNLPDHSIPAHIMSAIYISHVRRKLGANPLVSLHLSFTECSGTAQLLPLGTKTSTGSGKV